MAFYAYTAQPKTHALAFAFHTSIDRARDGIALLGARLIAWRRRARRRSELMMLSDRDLHDIRWTRAEAEAEARKPIWRA
jgi:uncharacterized protein YjiS (DUF1127 family)